MDKKNYECICCEKVLTTSQKLRQHYASTKSKYHIHHPTGQKSRGCLCSNSPYPLRKGSKKGETWAMQAPILQDKDQGGDSEAGPGLLTKAPHEPAWAEPGSGSGSARKLYWAKLSQAIKISARAKPGSS